MQHDCTHGWTLVRAPLYQREARCGTHSKAWSALHRRQQLGKVVALALVFCVAIVLSNVSLRIIPVSFNQVELRCWVGCVPHSTKLPAQRCLKRILEEWCYTLTIQHSVCLSPSPSSAT